MLMPYRVLTWLPIVFAISFPRIAFGLSLSLMAQLPTLQPPPPPNSVIRSGEDVPLCYIRIAGSTTNLHQLCGMSPNQANPNPTVLGKPNVSNRSNSPLSSTQGSQQPVRFGTGSAYADDSQ